MRMVHEREIFFHFFFPSLVGSLEHKGGLFPSSVSLFFYSALKKKIYFLDNDTRSKQHFPTKCEDFIIDQYLGGHLVMRSQLWPRRWSLCAGVC